MRGFGHFPQSASSRPSACLANLTGSGHSSHVDESDENPLRASERLSRHTIHRYRLETRSAAVLPDLPEHLKFALERS